MLKKRFLLATALALGLTANASADTFFTLRATANQSLAPGGVNQPNVAQVVGTGGSGGGIAYTNAFGRVAQSPLAAGDSQRVVTADIITGYNVNNGGGQFFAPTQLGQSKAVVIFAGEILANKVSGGGAVAEGTFTAGKAFVYISSNAQPFVRNDPTTWGVAPGNLVATYDLTAADDVVPGNPFSAQDFFPKAQVNTASINSLAGGQAQARILLTDANDQFLTVTDPVPPGLIPGAEGIFANIQETVFADQAQATPNAAGLAVLNQLAGLAGLGNLGGANTGFATGIGAGVDANYNPNIGLTTGDIGLQLGLSADPGRFAFPDVQVPEPATMLLFGLGLGATGCYLRGRRKVKA